MGHHIACYKWYRECKQSKARSCSSVTTETAHIHLKSCKEHNVIDAHLSEKFKRSIPGQDVQPVFANQHASQNKTYDMRQPQAPDDNRSQQQNQQQDEENPRRICY